MRRHRDKRDAGRGPSCGLPRVITGSGGGGTHGGLGDRHPGIRHLVLRGWAWTQQADHGESPEGGRGQSHGQLGKPRLTGREDLERGHPVDSYPSPGVRTGHAPPPRYTQLPQIGTVGILRLEWGGLRLGGGRDQDTQGGPRSGAGEGLAYRKRGFQRLRIMRNEEGAHGGPTI